MPLPNFKRQIDALAAFDFGSAQKQSIEHNKEVLLNMQAEQFAKGVDKDDNEILLEGRGYAFSTIISKRLFGRGLGAVVMHVTLFQTGALYKQLFISIVGSKFSFSSRVSYFGELMMRTGDVTGINYENRLEFAEQFVIPFVSKELQATTGFKIKHGVAV